MTGIPRCSCGSNHRSWRTYAKCRYPGEDVRGEGPWAFIHTALVPIGGGRYSRREHISLFPRESGARERQYAHPNGKCSGTCSGFHVTRLA